MQILLRFNTRVLLLFAMFLVPAMDIGIKVADDQTNKFCFELVAQEMLSAIDHVMNIYKVNRVQFAASYDLRKLQMVISISVLLIHLF